MAFSVRRRSGEQLLDPDDATIDGVLAELDGPVDEEHPDVSLSHDSEWTLSAFPSGVLVYENVESDDEPRYLDQVSRALVRTLWGALARGDLDTVEAQPWSPGYGP